MAAAPETRAGPMTEPSNPVGTLLAGSWRTDPAPATVSEAVLAAVAPIVASTGAGGLAWRRVARNPALCATAAAAELKACAQMQALDAARDDEAFAALAALFGAGAAAPLLFKGRALAAQYAERHLRPMGDVDLCAPPGGFDAVAALLARNGFERYAARFEPERGRLLCFAAPAGWPGGGVLVDLHERLDRFGLAPLAEVFARAVPLPAGAAGLLVPVAEDHLRLVIIHYLAHGGWRPLSLCDIAAMVEALPPDFDWELCLGPVPRRRRWLACTLALAGELLEARLDAVPDRCRADAPPGWLRETVLRAWQKPFSEHHARPRLGHVLRRSPLRVPAALAARWPDPIRATVELDAGFTAAPRWPYQLAHFARSALRGVAGGARKPLPDSKSTELTGSATG